jgi:hypothetical protein
MGGGIEQDSGDELYGGQDKQGGEVCFDLIGGLGTSVSRLEVGKTAIVKEDEAEHPGKGINHQPVVPSHYTYIWRIVKANISTRSLVGLLVNDIFFRKEVSQKLWKAGLYFRTCTVSSETLYGTMADLSVYVVVLEVSYV